MSRIYVFGYGSLMNPESAGRTLLRVPVREELLPARLSGWQRKWQLTSQAHLDGEPEPRTIVFLDIVPANNGTPMNGIILSVNEEELSRLDEREGRYHRRDITDLIASPPSDGIVYTYIGKDEHTRPGPGSMVMRRYEKIVAEALELWGPEFAEEYHRTTIPHTFPLHDGTYRWQPRKPA